MRATGGMKAASPVLQRIRELPVIDEMYDDDERRPTPTTIQIAEDIIRRSLDAFLNPGIQDDVDIHPFDGAIRMVWNRGPKTLKIVIPPSGTSYIYHHQEGQPSDLSYDTSSHSVEHWLLWLTTPSDTSVQSSAD